MYVCMYVFTTTPVLFCYPFYFQHSSTAVVVQKIAELFTFVIKA